MTLEKTKGPDENFCSSCGEIIKTIAEICPKCGVRQKKISNESSVPVVLNVIIGFLGILGIGHIVKGRVGKGILFLLCGAGTFILFWLTIWILVGLIFIPVYIGLWIWSIVDIKK
tara:strand:+ start:124 stop:468 length:345 start_codon:yes stop_codon:yes gene_type:complete